MPVILPEEDHAQVVGRKRGRRFEGVAEALSSGPDTDLGNQSESEFTGELRSWNHRSDTCQYERLETGRTVAQ